MVNPTYTFDEKKFEQVLHYLVAKTGNFPNVGKTVLYKLLYFTDFDFYELNEIPLTGETYRKLERGPAPTHFTLAIEHLKKAGMITECKQDHAGFKDNLIKFMAVKEPEVDLLSATEIQHITKVIGRIGNMSATQVSAYSHEDMPWKASAIGEDINYELVFYRSPAYSVREEEPDASADDS